MKLPITDQFLLEIYNLLSTTEDRGRAFIHPPKSFKHIALMIDDPIYQKYYKILDRKKFNKLIYWLKRNNYIKAKNLESKKGFVLTSKGMGKAIKAGIKMENGSYPKRDDGKWIMIMFDIPKQKNYMRGILRSVLQNLGYRLLQKSVWVTQYDVHEKTEMLLQFHSLDEYVKVFLIEELS